MDGKTIFFIIWFLAAVLILTTFYIKGRKALSIFPDIDQNQLKFRDKRASGYSTKSRKTKLGGARNSLDIVVTNDELWLKSMILFASISKENDLLHRIPLNKITSVEENGNNITIDFISPARDNNRILICTNRPKELIDALGITSTVNNNVTSGISKRQKVLLLATIVLICGTIVFFQYKTQRDKHERLATIGEIAPLTYKASKSRDVYYVNYSFITEQGNKIEGSRKSGNDVDKYINAYAIYNPNDAADYKLSFDYESYSPKGRIIFFFFLYFPAMIFVAFGFTYIGI
jgi:hypothetical protein